MSRENFATSPQARQSLLHGVDKLTPKGQWKTFCPVRGLWTMTRRTRLRRILLGWDVRPQRGRVRSISVQPWAVAVQPEALSSVRYPSLWSSSTSRCKFGAMLRHGRTASDFRSASFSYLMRISPSERTSCIYAPQPRMATQMLLVDVALAAKAQGDRTWVHGLARVRQVERGIAHGWVKRSKRKWTLPFQTVAG